MDWIGDAVLTVNGGRIIIPSETAKRLSAFAAWVAGKYGTKAGKIPVFKDRNYPKLTYTFTGNVFATISYPYSLTFDANSTTSWEFHARFSITDPGYYVCFDPKSEVQRDDVEPGPYFFSCRSFLIESSGAFGLHTETAEEGTYQYFYVDANSLAGGSVSVTIVFKWAGSELRLPVSAGQSFPLPVSAGQSFPLHHIAYIAHADESAFALDVSDTMQEVLDRLTALEEGQSIALDVGATQSMEIQEILQGILDAILAGDLAASAEIVDEAVEPVDPDPPVVPVVPSGLDKLGAALTSRFPFSIPWDVYKGVTLLAASPKAPYFEVDFMAPIADRVGGWQGSTKIVLDFSEYEIIGQVCRWTSTIGFCLMLATGTKRLIWTA